MTVLIGCQETARVLDISTQHVARLRKAGVLKPARKNPFRWRLSDVEAYRVVREANPKRGRRAHGVEFVMETK